MLGSGVQCMYDRELAFAVQARGQGHSFLARGCLLDIMAAGTDILSGVSAFE